VRDHALPLQIRRCATVREADGLAMSSRNVYLDAKDRVAAAVLHRALGQTRAAWQRGERQPAALAAIGAGVIASEPRATLDYFEVRGARAYVAARFGKDGPRVTRLIDNLLLGDA
jgi:pantoate--beta-alanine ligase